MKKLNHNDWYLLKFAIYGGISAYDYSIDSRWTFIWLIFALMMLAFWIVGDIKNTIENN
jgi:hypothetical protein